MRRKVNLFRSIDWPTVILYLLLVSFGWMNIYASAFEPGHEGILQFSQNYGRQLIWIVAALMLAITVFLFDSRFFVYFAYFIYSGAILLLILTLVIGTVSHGAKSWIQIGSFSIQPAEFAKVATALAVAKMLSAYNFDISKLRHILFISGIILLPPALIILQNDTGSALVYASFIFVLYREGLSGFTMLLGVVITILFILALLFPLQYIFIGLLIITALVFAVLQEKHRHLLQFLLIGMLTYGGLYVLKHYQIMHLPLYQELGISAMISGIIAIIWAAWNKYKRIVYLFLVFFLAMFFSTSVDILFHNVLSPHQRTRINVLLGVEEDPQGAGYNVNQSKIAIGSGRLTGKGFLQGTQTKLDFVPEQSTDFIFCTVGEEWGFAGSTALIITFVFFLARLLVLAERQRSRFSRIFGYAVVAILFIHIAINLGMTIGLAPVIGIPLPFFSYGGSSLWGFTLLVFIFLRLDASRNELF